MYTLSSILNIFWMYSSETNRHTEEGAELKCTTCWIFIDGMLIQYNIQNETELFTILQKSLSAPLQLWEPHSQGDHYPLPVFFTCIHGLKSVLGFLHTVSCLWACSCRSVFSIAVDYSTVQRYHYFIYPFYYSWPFVWLLLYDCFTHMSFGKHMDTYNTLLLIKCLQNTFFPC